MGWWIIVAVVGFAVCGIEWHAQRYARTDARTRLSDWLSHWLRVPVASGILLGVYVGVVRKWPQEVGAADIAFYLGLVGQWAIWALMYDPPDVPRKERRWVRTRQFRVALVGGAILTYVLVTDPYIGSGTVRYVHSHRGSEPALQSQEVRCGPLLQVVVPFVDRVYDYPLGFQRLEFSEAGELPAIRTETRNGHEVELDLVVVYRMFPDFGQHLRDISGPGACQDAAEQHYDGDQLSPPQRFRREWRRRLIEPLVHRVVRDNVTRYYLNQVYSSSSRAYIQGMMLAELNGRPSRKLQRKGDERQPKAASPEQNGGSASAGASGKPKIVDADYVRMQPENRQKLSPSKQQIDDTAGDSNAETKGAQTGAGASANAGAPPEPTAGSGTSDAEQRAGDTEAAPKERSPDEEGGLRPPYLIHVETHSALFDGPEYEDPEDRTLGRLRGQHGERYGPPLSSLAGKMFTFVEVVVLDVRILDREFGERIRRKHLKEEAREELMIEGRRLEQELANVQIRKHIALAEALIEADQIKVLAEAELQRAELDAEAIRQRGKAKAEAHKQLVHAHGMDANGEHGANNYTKIEIARALAAGIERVIITPELEHLVPIVGDIGKVMESLSGTMDELPGQQWYDKQAAEAAAKAGNPPLIDLGDDRDADFGGEQPAKRQMAAQGKPSTHHATTGTSHSTGEPPPKN